ncbi:hypothetical Protein YC6258_03621 [Gynuella sunshinyii YC6258]|uniref:Uncharacterized protein n=1 Tax=Gynuella sunshinyii YC6258 TaxID=1445510 RepID=A0A0C5VLQ5_9GAMM|nr:hypothetical Protein YC6258_03621 [Gynuella sunshinyii YC6258]
MGVVVAIPLYGLNWDAALATVGGMVGVGRNQRGIPKMHNPARVLTKKTALCVG